MSLRDQILDTFFPKRCVACKKQGNFFCEGCFDQIKFLKTQICPMCQKPSVDGITHHICRRARGLDALYSAVIYEGVVRPLIWRYKYKPYIRGLESTISLILRRTFLFEEDYYPARTLVTAVPLHWYRHRVRGFNQAEELARVLADLYGFETDFTMLTRTDIVSGLWRKPQTKLSKAERLRSVQGLFGLDHRVSPDMVSGRSILVVDDLWTTGATLRECAKVLKRAGAETVYAATFARV